MRIDDMRLTTASSLHLTKRTGAILRGFWLKGIYLYVRPFKIAQKGAEGRTVAHQNA